MKKILLKLYKKNKENIVIDIIEKYKKQWFCTISFLYFAQIISQGFLDYDKIKKIEYLKKYPDLKFIKKYWFSDYTNIDYYNTLLDFDFLLPDWIALQLYFFFSKVTRFIKSNNNEKIPFWIKNLNWTDFVPFFLFEMERRYDFSKFNVILYWWTEESLLSTKEKLVKKWYNIIYSQDWFDNLYRNKLEKELKWQHKKINIMLVWRSNVYIPIQELWTKQNIQKIKKNKLIVFNVWWLLDFLSWKNKRAPKILITLKLEWLWKFILNPKTQLKKVLYSFRIFLEIPKLIYYQISKIFK